MAPRCLAWMPGGPGADFEAWGLQAGSPFPSRAAYSAAGSILKHKSVGASLLCPRGYGFLRHLVGWVFRIWCGFTLPPRDGALPAGVRAQAVAPQQQL